MESLRRLRHDRGASGRHHVHRLAKIHYRWSHHWSCKRLDPYRAVGSTALIFCSYEEITSHPSIDRASGWMCTVCRTNGAAYSNCCFPPACLSHLRSRTTPLVEERHLL